jgi:hypothetical protein
LTPQTNSSPLMLVFLDRQRGREVPLEFKKDNPKEASIPKTVFPGLIKRMIDKLKPKNHPPVLSGSAPSGPEILIKVLRGFITF